uniref:STAS domain-containing protein n=1 Tax=Timema bartmani TaxID=61472 RepID=A0A7R9ETU9_9NEOP|nr:unnamed protein product [Timema bartmani]
MSLVKLVCKSCVKKCGNELSSKQISTNEHVRLLLKLDVLLSGFLVEFVSVPVVSGFVSAASLIIASSQAKGLLGLKYKAEGFVDTWYQLFQHIHQTRLWDLVLSVSCITILLALRKLKDLKPGGKSQTNRQKALGKVLWFVSTGRNAMVVVLCAALAYFFSTMEQAPFLLTGKIDAGLPPLAPPPFTTTFGNSTLSFLNMCQHLGSGIAVVPIVSILGNVAIAKAFLDVPGILIVLALSLLTPYFYFIPRATLSSVIICAVLFMVEVGMVSTMWKSNSENISSINHVTLLRKRGGNVYMVLHGEGERDLIPALVTFFACLGFGVELGILIGIAVDISFLLYFNARPRVLVETLVSPGGSEYVLVTPSSGLLFPAVDFVREAVAAASLEGGPHHTKDLPVVVNCRHVQRVDFTAAQGIHAIVHDFVKRGRQVLFFQVCQHVVKTLSSAGNTRLVFVATEQELIVVLKGLSRESRNGQKDTKLDMEESQGQVATSANTDQVDTRF